MATTWVSFRQIKTAVAIEHVLARYGVRLRRVGSELRGRCPLPTHTSRSRDSFSVSVSRNVWSCRSLSCMQARGGKAGANLLDLVAILERCSVRDAALRLQDWSGMMPTRVPVETVATPAANAPLSFALQHIDRHHPYLATRGLAPETVRTFGVGFYGGTGFLRGRIVIPIHDADGELVAYAGRRRRRPRPAAVVGAGADDAAPPGSRGRQWRRASQAPATIRARRRSTRRQA